MGGKFRANFLVNPEFFFPRFPYNANRFMLQALLIPISFQPETLATDLNRSGICTGEIASGKTEVIYGIQQVGLSNTIVSAKPNYPFWEGESLLAVITKLGQGNMVDLEQMPVYRQTYTNPLNSCAFCPDTRFEIAIFILYLPLNLNYVSTTKSAPVKFSKETYLYWYELMLLLRRFEEKTGQLYGMQKIRPPDV
jgi:hypothetical protein